MSELRVTELDFDQIKTNLKNFLASQTEFQDYNFDGSAMSVLLDILAYNTHYNAMLAHLQANEMFIDTAIKRSSVVSIAKSLGYVPRSRTSARAVVTLVVTPDSPLSELTLTPDVSFNTTINGKTFTFFVEEEQTVSLAEGVFTFENVTLIEGTRLTNTYPIFADNTSGPIVLATENIDISTLQVVVQESETELVVESFDRATNALAVGGDSPVFWVEETTDGLYQLVFGDGVIGKELTVGNIVRVSFIVSSGAEANGARSFSLNGDIDGQESVTIELINAAGAGQDRESIDSIRFNATRFNSTRNRLVTAEDYRAMILAGFEKAKAVAVWGGEENDPPIYGKVFITIDPKSGYVLTDTDRDFILTNIIAPRSVMSIQHEFVDPDYLYITLGVSVTYDPRLSTLSSSEIATAVREDITTFFEDNLSTLDKTFFLSRLIDTIDNSNSAIIASLVDMGLQRRLRPVVGTTLASDLLFLAALRPLSIESTIFTTTVNTVQSRGRLVDDGNGNLNFVNLSNAVLIQNAGTVDYDTGIVSIRNVVFSGFVGLLNDLRIHAEPTELSRNISPSIIRTAETSVNAVAPTPSRNVILVLDDSQTNESAGLSAGLSVTARPFIENV